MRKDELGRWVNTEFPPVSFEKYPRYSGYRTSNEEMLFYQFSLMWYLLRIEYKGKEYHAYIDDKRAWIEDPETGWESEEYPTGNDLLKHFRFEDGKTLLELAPASEDLDVDIMG